MVEITELPNLSPIAPIVEPNLKATTDFNLFIKKLRSAITNSFASIAAVLNVANAAQDSADAAQATADEALSEAGGTSSSTKLTLSFPESCIIESFDLGGSTGASIAVNSHTRRYGDGTSVAVTGNFVVGSPFSYDLLMYVSYLDPGMVGGAVVFEASIDPVASANDPTTGRHYVGSIGTALDGGPMTTGSPATPPGGGASAEDLATKVTKGPFTAGADAPVIGYVEMQDSSGTLRKFAIIA